MVLNKNGVVHLSDIEIPGTIDYIAAFMGHVFDCQGFWKKGVCACSQTKKSASIISQNYGYTLSFDQIGVFAKSHRGVVKQVHW